jgi:hypothetical protein
VIAWQGVPQKAAPAMATSAQAPRTRCPTRASRLERLQVAKVVFDSAGRATTVPELRHLAKASRLITLDSFNERGAREKF